LHLVIDGRLFLAVALDLDEALELEWQSDDVGIRQDGPVLSRTIPVPLLATLSRPTTLDWTLLKTTTAASCWARAAVAVTPTSSGPINQENDLTTGSCDKLPPFQQMA
jgi:hypothetical protein